MFCIATFIVFGVLAIFSASYRPLALKAWHCTVRRMTFRPCDITFGEEMKGKLIGKIVFTHPRLARFLDRWIDVLSFLFVALSIWSLVYTANAGLNLWVYDTCNPQSGESCSLSGEACSIDQASLSLITALREGRMIEWTTGPVVRFTETLSRIPDRLKTWEPKEYLAPSATFYHPENTALPYTLEIIDPGCQFCKKLTKNLKEAGVMDRTNVSYLLYPIPLVEEGKFKFPHSYRISSYIEATKRVPLQDSAISGDWQLLERLFAEPQGTDVDLQTRINIGMNDDQVESMLDTMLRDIGYSDLEISRITRLASSEEVSSRLAEQKVIVEDRVRTIKIPTLLYSGRRYDRVVSVEKLSVR